MTQLSPNFTLAELIRSNTATARGISNVPTAVHQENLRRLVVNVLQPLRDIVGRPVSINSGYRSPALNRAVGGSTTSQHSHGEAADIRVSGMTMMAVAELIRDRLPFDQLILEGIVPGNPNVGWVHVSYREGRLRRSVLTKIRGQSGYRQGLVRL
jgi:zinc D-Ala-D-Ala carboxypeptidase